MSKSDLSSIEKIVQKQLEKYFSDSGKTVLVIGVSGGADSMCLLHVLHRLGLGLHVVHINYQKRGAASDEDARLVEETANKLGLESTIIKVDSDEAQGQNFQHWARAVRYEVFETKAGQMGADGIAIAHHRDDQIETILQKIFRGSGLASWSAMQVWNGRLFRPLLRVDRQQIEDYCKNQSVIFHDDGSNFDSDFARNFLRNEWLPELEQHFPGWRANVLRVAEQAEIFASSLQFILQTLTDDKDRLNRRQFLKLNAGLQKSVLIYYVNRIDETAEISRDALSEISKLEALQTGASIQLATNMELMRDRDFLKLVIDTKDPGVFLILKKEDIPGQGISFNGLQFVIQAFKNPDFSQNIYLDADAMVWPLHLRNWKDGDRLQPLGMKGHQTVADHLTNRKISAAEKQKALVLESFEETICAVIFPPIENRRPPGTISERVKCNSSTRQCLIIKQIV